MDWICISFILYGQIREAAPSWKLRQEGGGLDCYFTRKGVESEQSLDCCESTNYRICWERGSYSMQGCINHLANLLNEQVTEAWMFRQLCIQYVWWSMAWAWIHWRQCTMTLIATVACAMAMASFLIEQVPHPPCHPHAGQHNKEGRHYDSSQCICSDAKHNVWPAPVQSIYRSNRADRLIGLC